MLRRPCRLALVALLASTAALAQNKDRAAVADQYKWNLTDLYKSDDDWRAAKQKLVAELPKLGRFKGTVTKSGAKLAAALDAVFEVRKEYLRLSTYSGLISDQDTRVAPYQAMRQEVVQVGTQLGAAVSYLEPEILTLSPAKLQQFLKQEPKLKIYSHYLDDLLRRKAHTLSQGEEKLIADAGLMADAPDALYGIFANADFPFPEVKLADGKTVKIDKSSFNLYRQLPNRDDRKKVFETFFNALGRYKATFGGMLAAQVNRDIFYAKARKYDSAQESALDQNAIPVSVYKSLVENVNKALPTFQRYLKLRQKMLGVDQLHYYDLYAPLVGSVKLEYPVEKAEETILKAVQQLGPDYVNGMKQAFASRWIDMYPNEGKRSGAYMSGSAYDVHPYMLMNYNGQYEDLTTLIHESGHAMQTYFSNKAQPFATADYPIFVAEVASTFNEALLMDYLLKTIQDDSVRMALLGNYLENLRLTVFRQTQFAEFEARIHELAEKGEPLTGENLDKEYLAIARRYYGHDQGVAVVDDYIAHEWAFIPHFYYNFYVYQYATSFTASAALSEKVMSGDQAATQKYLAFLSAGGSDYPIALLKNAGVDMTTSEPITLTIQKMNRVMDELEALQAKTKAPAAPAKK